VAGGAVLIAMLLGILRSDPIIMGLAAAAVLGGIVVAGSNRSTAKEAADDLTATEAKRTELISQLELQTGSERDRLEPLPPRLHGPPGEAEARAGSGRTQFTGWVGKAFL